jgi:hypothetical protein
MNLFKWLVRKREDIIRQRKTKRAEKRMQMLVEKHDKLCKEGSFVLLSILGEIYDGNEQKEDALSEHLSENCRNP